MGTGCSEGFASEGIYPPGRLSGGMNKVRLGVLADRPRSSDGPIAQVPGLVHEGAQGSAVPSEYWHSQRSAASAGMKTAGDIFIH